jgi:hypothetical protein
MVLRGDSTYADARANGAEKIAAMRALDWRAMIATPRSARSKAASCR